METYAKLADELGLERAVFVQAKPFATDNACLLDAIQKFGPQRARGIAVVTDQIGDKELEQLITIPKDQDNQLQKAIEVLEE